MKNSAKEYVITRIKELLGPDFKTIQGYTFSSKNLPETEIVDSLLKATDRVLFPDGKHYVFGIMLDYYKEGIGPAEMLDIIRHFVNWIDLYNRF